MAGSGDIIAFMIKYIENIFTRETKMILHGNVYSQQLEMNTGISVLVPNDFEEGKKYKVAYLLHGIHGDNDTWIENTMLPIYSREKNIVFVMPSALRSFYTDTASGQKYFSYVSDELPHIMKSVFHITTNRKETAVIGCSMGGYGALKIGLSRPESFGFIGAFSSAILTLKEYLDEFKTEEQIAEQRVIWGDQMVNDMMAVFGSTGKYDPKDDVFELAKDVEKSEFDPKIYMACGLQDYLYEENDVFQKKMKTLDLDFKYEEWDGEHNWVFFDQALRKAIRLFDNIK